VTALLIVLTVLEVVILLAVLVGYLIKIERMLRTISMTLAKTAMGVRAIDTQTTPLRARLTAVDGRLSTLAERFGALADRARTR
jgi:hypothetical protein